ncbi:MAG: hypothetical protein CMB80_07295 [Flammeovirgaceae bacterium]|nr:hypothetical protein [Flammeovirgaceae bacterium]HCX22371.1 hypothetical protein [Cytophagales bacterium]|tara:strand:+ start:897 stop:1598 length:702 start_codon:yes stop_codon:yes gene_type:complete
MLKLSVLTLIMIPFSLNAQSALSILEKHFESYGQEEWNQVRTISVDGKWVDEDYHAYDMKLTWKQPDKVRVEGKYQGKSYVEAYNGLIGWVVAPWKDQYEIQRMDDAEEIVIRNVFTAGSPLYEPREHLEFSGLMDMEGVLYNTFTLSEGSFKRVFYLDRDSHRLYYELIENQFGKEKVSVLKVIDKYKTYGPMLVPTSVIFEGLDMNREFVFDEIYLGTGANDSIFDYPEGQ